MDCFRDMQTRQAGKDNHYNTQHIDSLFTIAERLGNLFVMWLSGKLYELLPFDKHIQRQHPLCKCPVGRGIVLHISKLPRSHHTCWKYEWYWGLLKPKASPRTMTSLTALMTVNISANFLSGCISWLAFQQDGAHPWSRMCSSTVNNL